jgi:xylitol oxidase
LPHISVAGACATATHGSGVKNGNLATAARAIEFVNANGDLITLSRDKDGERFEGAVVGLGGLGIVTRLTLDVQPTYFMKQAVYQHLPVKELTANFNAIEASGYSVSLFTDWITPKINQVWIKSRVEKGDSTPLAPEFYGAKLATRNLHPLENLSAENCTEQMGVPGPWYERLPHFRMGFTPSNGHELQSEYFVPAEHAVEAILAVYKISDVVSPHLLISEIRTIAADNLWMSPCYKRDCVTIHFTWKPDWPAVKAALPVVEKTLAPFHARPHWGKLFTMSPAHLQPLIEKLPEFKELLLRYDAQGKFRNDFLAENLY